MRKRAKDVTLWSLLILMAGLGPLVAQAGVTVIWPASEHTVNVVASPPLTILKGADYTAAANVSFLSAWAGSNNNASFSITLSGLAGGNVTIDRYVNISKNSNSVSQYNVTIATALSGALNPDVLKVRLWTGSTAPTNDASTGVCAVLDLEAALNVGSTGNCTASTDVQLIVELPSGASGSATVSIRLGNITLT